MHGLRNIITFKVSSNLWIIYKPQLLTVVTKCSKDAFVSPDDILKVRNYDCNFNRIIKKQGLYMYDK